MKMKMGEMNLLVRSNDATLRCYDTNIECYMSHKNNVVLFYFV